MARRASNLLRLKRIVFFYALFFTALCHADGESAPYVLASGDTVSIQVFDEPDLSIDALINDEGKISYPLLGVVAVNNMTLRQLETRIADGLRGRYLVSPQVRVSIKEYRKFFINGEVSKPGGYAFIPGLTLRKAIALAGGFTEKASKDRIYVIHEDDPKKTGAKISLEAMIRPGDIVTIQEFKQIFVSGEVKKPGNYEYQPELTLRKAIALAGGFTGRASENKIKLIRDNDPQRKEILSTLDTSVNPGDIITVGERYF